VITTSWARSRASSFSRIRLTWVSAVAGADDEPRRDLRIREAGGDERQHLALGQLLELGR